MKVLLTGATGFLGSEIARELVRQGHAVRVLMRKTSKLDGLTGVSLDKAYGDILDRKSIEDALVGMDAMIHCAGHTGARRRDKAALYKVNVDGARNVYDAVAASANPNMRVVHTSTIAAVGATKEPRLLDENATWNLGGTGYHYMDSKRQGEEIALARAKAGANVIVLNPGMILGPGDVYGTSTRVVTEYLSGRSRFYPRGGLSFCDVREVAKAHVAALTKGRAGERYILAGMNQSFKDVLGTLHELTGKYRPMRAPHAISWLVALVSEAMSLVTRHSLEEVNRPMIKHVQKFTFMDPAKAERELGYVVRPFDESVRDTIADFIRRGLVSASTPKLQALSPA